MKSENMSYPACPVIQPGTGNPCNKKMVNNDGGVEWWCERCQQSAQPVWRYMLSLQVSDHTGSEWLTGFQVRCDRSPVQILDISHRFSLIENVDGCQLVWIKLCPS